jgi:putative phosphoribosyl transferase
LFNDRHDAGTMLAEKLLDYAEAKPIVYALPRGGLPVAEAVASRLSAPLDLILVRKLGAPRQPELAIGAIVDGASPAVILHDDLIADLGVTRKYIEEAKNNALAEIERRRKLYMRGATGPAPAGRTVVIVDDGLATGATMEAAVKAMRNAKAKHIVVAVPVAPAETVAALRRIADEVVCLETPSPFWSVGGQYRSFPQLTDADVIETLARCRL